LFGCTFFFVHKSGCCFFFSFFLFFLLGKWHASYTVVYLVSC
jgi:hypothetical protein